MLSASSTAAAAARVVIGPTPHWPQVAKDVGLPLPVAQVAVDVQCLLSVAVAVRNRRLGGARPQAR